MRKLLVLFIPLLFLFHACDFAEAQGDNETVMVLDDGSISGLIDIYGSEPDGLGAPNMLLVCRQDNVLVADEVASPYLGGNPNGFYSFLATWSGVADCKATLRDGNQRVESATFLGG